jgi:hypothetical protein
MNVSFEDKGVWWFPGSDKRFKGKLKWDPARGACVEIDVSEHDEISLFASMDDVTFYGKLDSIPYVTVEHAMVVSLPALPFKGEVHLASNSMIKGSLSHASVGEIEMKVMSSEITGMNSWLDETAISVKRDGGRTLAECDGRKEIPFYEAEGMRVSVVRYNKNSVSRFRFSAESASVFEVTSDKPFQFASGLKLLQELRAFLSFALDRPVVFESISGCASQDLEVPGFGRAPSMVDCFMAMDATVIDSSKRERDDLRMLFKLSPVEVSSHAFKVFRQIYNEHRMSIDFFFSQTYGSNSYIYQQFADMVHGLEGLHRGLAGGEYMEDDKFKADILPKLTAAIPVTLDPPFRSSLKDRMQYLNQYSLRRRLRLLVDSHSTCVSPYIRNPGAFVEQVAGMRNAIAHPKGGGNDAQSTRRHLVMLHRVRLLFQFELLSRLGFSTDFIRDRSKHFTSARYSLRRLREDDLPDQ